MISVTSNCDINRFVFSVLVFMKFSNFFASFCAKNISKKVVKADKFKVWAAIILEFLRDNFHSFRQVSCNKCFVAQFNKLLLNSVGREIVVIKYKYGGTILAFFLIDLLYIKNILFRVYFI